MMLQIRRKLCAVRGVGPETGLSSLLRPTVGSWFADAPEELGQRSDFCVMK